MEDYASQNIREAQIGLDAKKRTQPWMSREERVDLGRAVGRRVDMIKKNYKILIGPIKLCKQF